MSDYPTVREQTLHRIKDALELANKRHVDIQYERAIADVREMIEESREK